MNFGRKHVETGRNCSHELATFLKYHMPLIELIKCLKVVTPQIKNLENLIRLCAIWIRAPKIMYVKSKAN